MAADRGRGAHPKPVEVDPYNPDSYMRFVAVAAVDILGSQLGHTLRKDVAEKVFRPPISPSLLAAELAKPRGPSPTFLGRLERLYFYKGFSLHNGAPWLTSFHEELLRLSVQRRGGETATELDVGGSARYTSVEVPLGWLHNLAVNRPRNSTEAFVQGHALRAFVLEARQVAVEAGQEAETQIVKLLDQYRLTEKAERTVDSLLEVVAGPPHTGLPAVRLIASYGGLALERVRQFICHSHPAGFRAIRILTRLLAGQDSRTLRPQIEPLLRDIYEQSPPDPYPARSLLVEALRFAPEDWPWVNEALLARAEDESRPIRERVYAAYALFDRGKFKEAEALAGAFAASQEDGLSYASAFLKVRVKQLSNVRTAYPWPNERPEHTVVFDSTIVIDDDASVPPSVSSALKRMVRGALLTIDGTIRRSICESVQAAGLGVSAAAALIEVMRNDRSPAWLVEHAAFLAGYLQTGYPRGADNTVRALLELAGQESDGPAQSAVRHAAMWGIGDVMGGLETTSQLDNKELEEALLAAVSRHISPSESSVEVRRAASYTAAMLARRLPLLKDRPGETAVSTVLLKAASDADELVRRLASWGREIESAHGHDSYLATTAQTAQFTHDEHPVAGV